MIDIRTVTIMSMLLTSGRSILPQYKRHVSSHSSHQVDAVVGGHEH